MNHATPKAPINEQTHPASPHHREPTTGEGSRTRESSDRSLTSPAANALDWKICALGSSFDLDEVLATAPATEILPGLDALVPPNPMASPKPIRRVDQPRSGLTLLELVVVLMITVALAGVMVPLVTDSATEAREKAAEASLTALRDVVANYWIDSGALKRLPRPNLMVTPTRQDAPQLVFLFANPDHYPDATFTFDPTYRVGWRGPYLREATGIYTVGGTFTTRYGESGDAAVVDPWGNPIVIQNPGPIAVGLQDVRLVSAGPNGVIDISPTTFSSALNDSNDGDDVYVAFTLR